MEFGTFDSFLFNLQYDITNDDQFKTLDLTALELENNTNQESKPVNMVNTTESDDELLQSIDLGAFENSLTSSNINNQSQENNVLPIVTRSPRDLQKYIMSKRNLNTQRKTDNEGTKFSKWLHENGGDLVLTEIGPESMDNYIGHYILECKKKTGEEYEPDSLTSIHRSVDRYLRDHGYKYSLVKDDKFSTSRSVLESKRKELKSMGKGNKENRAEPLTKDEEELLWDKGQLGDHNPKVLLQTLWFLTTKHMGFRGSHESRQLKWGDISIDCDQFGEFLSFKERNTKTRTGENSKDSRPFTPKVYANSKNDLRCPVRLLRKYETHRPLPMLIAGTPFYLAVNNMRSQNCDDQSWYKCSALGVHSINHFMKDMCVITGITGRKTNHSVRKTTCTTLLHAGVPPTMIQQVTGHKNVSSINNYAVASKQQQKAMCDILARENDEQQNLLPIITGNPGSSVLSNLTNQNISSPLPSSSSGKPASNKTNSSNSNSNPLGLMAGASINNCTFNITLNNLTKEDNTQSSQVVYNGPKYKRMRYNVIESDSDTE